MHGSWSDLDPILPILRHFVINLVPVLADMRCSRALDVEIPFECVVRLEREVRGAQDHLADVVETVGEVAARPGTRVPREGETEKPETVVLVEHGDGEGAVLGPEAQVPEPLGGVACPLLAGVGTGDGKVERVFDDQCYGVCWGQRPVFREVVTDIC